MRSPITKRVDRRQFLRAATAAGLTAGVAGCTDTAADDPAESSETTSNETDEVEADDDDESDQEDGLDIDFTWDDIEHAERDFYERRQRMPGVGDGTEGLEHIDRSFLENANLLDYDEYQEALIGITNHLIHDTLGEKTSGHSSSLTGGASAAINIAIQEELENNETYREEGLQIKMMPLGNDGHGYTQVASTHHPLTTVDSNEPIVGPTQDAPLDERNTRDPISRFVDQDFEDVGEFERSTYRGFPQSVYSSTGDGKLDISIDPSVVDEYYEEAVFADDGELWMGPVRQAVATLATMMERDAEYFEDANGIAINAVPTELPERRDYESLDEYAEELVTDVDEYETAESFRDALEP